MEATHPTVRLDRDRRTITTTFERPGYRIVHSLGVIRSMTVRSRSSIGSIGASLQTIVGGNRTLYTDVREHAYQEAFGVLAQHAAAFVAPAIIGTRDDANEIGAGVTDVLATAVIAEPVRA